MASVNKVIIVGNLGQDPDIRYTADGSAVANISVATTDTWKDKQTGEKKENTEWHRIVFFKRLAEIVGEYLKKGSQVYIDGKLRTRKWQDQSGNDRYTTEIVASDMKMLSKNHELTTSKQQNTGQKLALNQSKTPAHSMDQLDDDIPF